MIIPVYNGGTAFVRCLEALDTTDYDGPWELLVVDDGSTDGSASLAQTHTARVLLTPHPRSGPATARNVGAQQAAADTLLFLDADVLVRPDTVGRAVACLANDRPYVAVFGSYDDTPTCCGFISQAKNLLHHYTHQMAQAEASTFWAGCGAVRRAEFWAVGGFDAARYPRPMVEDIELGTRLRQQGGRIYLDKTWQVTHQKCWSLRTWLQSDVVDRGIPWWRLILATRSLPNDLNTDRRTRVAVLMLGWFGLSLMLGFWSPPLRWLAVVAGLGLFALGWPLYRWFARKRGWWFAARAIPWHWVYLSLGALSVAAGTVQWAIEHLDYHEDGNR